MSPKLPRCRRAMRARIRPFALTSFKPSNQSAKALVWMTSSMTEIVNYGLHRCKLQFTLEALWLVRNIWLVFDPFSECIARATRAAARPADLRYRAFTVVGR